jgi:hypothetical protein
VTWTTRFSPAAREVAGFRARIWFPAVPLRRLGVVERLTAADQAGAVQQGVVLG